MNSASLNTLSDHVLEVIRRRPSARYTIDRLAQKNRCEKSEIINAVELLRQTGYEIESDKPGNIRFVSAPDLLLATEITYRLKTKFIGRKVFAYKSVQSTNIIATQLAEAKAPEGSLVVSESQTKGRGRLGREWHSPVGTGIYLSLILYPDIDPAKAPGLSIMAAVSLAETIAAYKPKTVNIKWPNDCLVNGSKVAGILTELSAEIGRTHHVIVGVGINVNQGRRDFPKQISRSATSLRIELKQEIHRVEFLQRFLANFEKDYRRFKKVGIKGIRRQILQYSNLIGKKINLDMSGNIISGRALDIDQNGGLVMETPGGIRTFNAGEVTVLKKPQRR